MARKKARSLPFVVQPRLKPVIELIGTEESGQIEVERRGYLSVAEKSWVQALEVDDDTQGRLHRLAIKMGAELGMEPRAALDLCASTELSDPRLKGYQEELIEAMSAMQRFNERRKIVGATCLLINRVEPSWEVEDTMKMHVDLIESLYQLYLEEEARSVEALEAAVLQETGEKQKEPELGKD